MILSIRSKKQFACYLNVFSHVCPHVTHCVGSPKYVFSGNHEMLQKRFFFDDFVFSASRFACTRTRLPCALENTSNHAASHHWNAIAEPLGTMSEVVSSYWTQSDCAYCTSGWKITSTNSGLARRSARPESGSGAARHNVWSRLLLLDTITLRLLHVWLNIIINPTHTHTWWLLRRSVVYYKGV